MRPAGNRPGIAWAEADAPGRSAMASDRSFKSFSTPQSLQQMISNLRVALDTSYDHI
jgi:hypothetical protein